MLQRLGLHRPSLAVQMVFSFVALVVITAAAIGLPAIWLLREQQDRLAWALVAQGRESTQALLAARQSEMNSLALLTAQRPSLQALLTQRNQGGLLAYLQTLQVGAGLDLIIVCDADGQVIGSTLEPPLTGGCMPTPTSGFYLEKGEPGLRGWLLSIQSFPAGTTPGKILVGQAVDDQFVSLLRDQTGLEQILSVQGSVVATSFKDGAAAMDGIKASATQATPAPGAGGLKNGSLLVGDSLYYLQSWVVDGGGLEATVALPVSEIMQTQRDLSRAISAGILLVAAIGTLFGVFRSRRISRPLEELRDSAEALRKGDLTTPVVVRTNLREAELVAFALEDARIALQHTLTELRQEKEWVDHLLESVIEGIITLDRRGRVTFFSQGAETITGWKQDQVLGRPIDLVFRLPEKGESFSQQMPAPGRKQKITVKLEDGRQAVLAISGARLTPPEASKASVALVLRDVSDEEAIHNLLGDFLANITHEFRTPLAALDASIELLIEQLPDLSVAELQELLNSLHLGVLSLQTLIDNLLEGASIETGRFRVYPRQANLEEIIQETARSMQPLFEKYRQELVLQVPANLPPVQIDPRRTEQVLVNLLSNAIKWGPQESRIYLAVTIETANVKVSVTDQGPGIPPEQRRDLFRRFAHIDLENSRAEYSSGLGLSVVKAIVEAQGGNVGVEDGPGEGARFWFTIPLNTETAIAGQAS